MEVMVFKHQCPLRTDKVLKPHAALREKLCVACDFRSVLIDGGVYRTRSRIEVGNHPSDRFEPKAHHQGRADQASSGMWGPAKNLLADQLKAFYRKVRVRRVPGDDPDLWR